GTTGKERRCEEKTRSFCLHESLPAIGKNEGVGRNFRTGQRALCGENADNRGGLAMAFAHALKEPLLAHRQNLALPNCRH
ncbi:MAG: hypothetical protein ACOY3X_00980, partial [Pseudomonadota bacterium]